jgi:sigma-B regulation protein RsbU (phosphoserine phosphatase)
MFTVIIEDINETSPKQVLDNVMDGINAFVKGAEQFDDITMMCLKYKGVK